VGDGKFMSVMLGACPLIEAVGLYVHTPVPKGCLWHKRYAPAGKHYYPSRVLSVL